MKACPYCEAELRDSVIRCLRCGRSLTGEPAPDTHREPVTAPAPTGTRTAPSPTGGSRVAPSSPPAQPPPSNTWVTPSTRTAGPAASSPPDLASRRALPTTRRSSARPDLILLLAALAAIAAAVFAWRSVGEPWVKLVITDTSDPLDPKLVGEIALRGQAALVGTIGQALAVVLGASGLAWLIYCFDRGTTIPWFVTPAIAVMATIGGAIALGLSAQLWFVWRDAAPEHARALGMSADQLRELLDTQPEPLVEIQRLSGLLHFAGGMLAGFLGAVTAWSAYRKRL